MTKPDFNELPWDLKARIVRSYKALCVSDELSDLLSKSFNIDELKVYALSDGTVSINGVVADENEKQHIEEMLGQIEGVKKLVSDLRCCSLKKRLIIT